MKRHSPKALLILSMMIFAIHVNAQYFNIQNINEKNDKVEFNFPLLSGETKAGNSINIFLQCQELDLLPGKQKNSIFEKIPSKDDSLVLNYKILANTSKLFSVRISNMYKESSHEEYYAIYNFDSQTGRPVQFSDLLTKQGYRDALKFVISHRKVRLGDIIKTFKNPKDKDIIQIYSGCLLGVDNDDLDEDDLIIKEDGLHLVREACSGIDLPGSESIYEDTLDYKFLQPYLNEYGKCLLSAINMDCIMPVTSVPHKGVFKGKINSLHQITLIIHHIQKDSFTASCFYNEQEEKINLYGTYPGNSALILKDTSASNTGDFNLKIQIDGSLKGSWSDGKHTYPVELEIL